MQYGAVCFSNKTANELEIVNSIDREFVKQEGAPENVNSPVKFPAQLVHNLRELRQDS